MPALSHRRILFLRGFFAVCLALLAVRLGHWQLLEAYDLTVKACRQRLAVKANLGWPRADFTDRYGRPLTNRDPIAIAESGAAVGAAASASRYGRRPLAVHLLGYVNPGDGHGAAGLEQSCDDILAQGQGYVLASVVDGRGQALPGQGLRLLRPPGSRPRAVRLTIDADLQMRLEEIADQTLGKGAIVVIDPRTGEILAMVSRPVFDPGDPGASLDKAGSPFLNRAVAAYHPGSVFKLAVLAAALESAPGSFWWTYDDQGALQMGDLSFHCPGRGHGLVTLADAVAYSCNTAFIQLGLDLGAEKIIGMAERLGLGSPASRDVPGEALGNLPAKCGQTPGDVANTSIGQKDVYATPLQIVRLIAAVANGGLLPTCRVTIGQEDGRGRIQPFDAPGGARRVLRPGTAEMMKKLLAGVVRYGTGRAAALPVGVGGKTGTAQSGQLDTAGRPFNHAWFGGFAPLDDPRYAAVVFVEEGDSGGRVAAPIFRRVIEAALALEKTRRHPETPVAAAIKRLCRLARKMATRLKPGN